MKNPRQKAKKVTRFVDTLLSFCIFLAVVFFMVGGGMQKTVKAIQEYKYEQVK